MKSNILLFSLFSCLLISMGFMFGSYFGSKKNQFCGKFSFSADVEHDHDVNWSKGVTDETIVKFNIFTVSENKKIINASFFWNPVLKDTKYVIYNQGVISEIHSSSTND